MADSPTRSIVIEWVNCTDFRYRVNKGKKKGRSLAAPPDVLVILERVLKLDEHYVNTTISLLTATRLRPKALFRRFAERLFGLIYALPNSL